MKDLLALSSLTGLIMALLLLPGTPEAVRFGLAPLLVLALPGYALVMALDRQRRAQPIEVIVFSLGGSIGLTILTGLGLNLTPWGLRRESWALALGLVVLALTAIAAWRRKRTGSGPAFTPLSQQVRELAKGWSMRPMQWVQLGFALVLVASTLVVAQAGLRNNPDPGFTQLWLLPSEPPSPQVVRIGITNYEWATTTYSLRVVADEQLLSEWPTIRLQPGATWQITETLSLERGTFAAVEALLYRADDPQTVYRRTRLVLPTER